VDCEKCESCENTANWWEIFKNTVDVLMTWFCGQMFINVVLQSQQMRKRVKKNEEVALTSMGIVKHDFPRQIFEETQVDPKTGALNIKKGEKWINTLTPIVTYF